jgi:hypothetical protein
MLGKAIANEMLAENTTPGSKLFVHLINHSAGSGFIEEFAKAAKEKLPSLPIHMTLLDSFCPNPNSCSYGEHAMWADQYFDHRFSLDRNFNPFSGFFDKETAVILPYVYNFDITALDNYGIIKYKLSYNIYTHAFPYRYYIKMAGGDPKIGDSDIPFSAREENDLPFGVNLAAWSKGVNDDPFSWLKNDEKRYGSHGLCEMK